MMLVHLTPEVSMGLFPGKPETWQPTEEALWRFIDERFEATLGALSRADAETRVDQRLAAASQVFEEFQALYALLMRCNYETFHFRQKFAVVNQLLRPSLNGGKRDYGDIGYYCDDRHREDVWEIAKRIASRLQGELSRPLVPPAQLSPREVREMRGAFTEVRYGNDRVVYLEASFAGEMLQNWDKPRLTTTAHAIETLHMVSRRRWRLIEEGKAVTASNRAPGFRVDPRVLRFVAESYRGDHFSDPLDEQSLYATSAGIAVFKAERDITCAEQPSAAQLLGLFEGTRIDHRTIREWVLQRLSEMLSNERIREASLVEINHALRILWNLSADVAGGHQALVSGFRSSLLLLLRQCIRIKEYSSGRDSSTPLTTFVTRPDTEAACLTACLAASRIAKHAGVTDSKLHEHFQACREYVWACRSPIGGFGSSVGHTPDLLHTYMALSMNREWKWRTLSATDVQGVLDFMGLCSRDGGYALLPEWRPSAYGTRLALQILDRLELPLFNLAEMAAFVRSLLIATNDGRVGYRGLPSASTSGVASSRAARHTAATA